MVYDQAQSPRLGQATPVESTYVQIFDVDPSTPTADLTEAAWPGMLIFRTDTSQLYIYNAEHQAWQDVAGGVAGHLTFVGPTEPVANAIGDTWFDDDNAYKQYVWDGATWQPVVAGNKTTPAPAPPATPSFGDSWLDTTDWQQYIWDNTRWQPTKVPKAELNSKAAIAMAKAVNQLIPPGTEALIVVWYRDATPTSGSTNDLWVRTTDYNLYRYDGSTWNQVADPSLSVPIGLAGEPRSISDEQISMYYQSSAPTGQDAADIGDLWTDSNGLLHAWTGAAWLAVQATADDIAPNAVDTIHIVDHAIKTPKIADYAISTSKISDFAIPVTKMVTTTHMIY